ncbi:MAG: hypothetical protein ACREQ9_14155 [Candidatus Binatia bacterium]
MTAVACPGCGSAIDEAALVRGSRIECPLCAGLVLEVVEKGRGLDVREVHFASCPVCDARIEVPRDAAAGATMGHCGRTFRLTLEFGAYALE